MPNQTQEEDRYQAETEQIKAHTRLINAQAAEVEQRNNGKG